MQFFIRQGGSMNFILQRAGNEHIPSIIHLVTDVYEQIPAKHKDWFVINPEEDQQLLEAGESWAYTAVDADTGQLAAAFIAAFPGMTAANMGYDCGLPEAELPYVAHMDTAVTAVQYRGHGLQKQLMELAEADLYKAGYRYLCCTVHPDNKYSKNNILQQGYRIVDTKEKYHGFLRHICFKEL